MSQLKNFTVIFCLMVSIFSAFSCQTKSQKRYLIGFSQLGEGDAWRQAMKEEIERELVFHPEFELVYKEAGYSTDKQLAQIRELLNQKIDLLIVSPNEANPLTEVIDKVYKSGIPVITVDRNISSHSFNTFIGADNVEVGKLAGNYAATYLKEKGNIIEITGLSSSTPAKEREKGFKLAIDKYPGVNIKKIINGDWLAKSVDIQLLTIKEELKKAQLVFAHNDVMAATAADVCKKLGYYHIKVIGVDAQPATGLTYVADKTLLASVLYPTGGGEAIRAASKILNNEKISKRDHLRTIMVDSSNVFMLQQQFQRIVSQQKDIVRQDILLKEQTKTFKTQRNLITVLLTSLFMLLMLSGLLIYLRRKNIKANELLKEQNLEISSKSEQIRIMAQKVQDASEQRINFFTNISHELKTPLTLIIAPAEDAMGNNKISPFIRSQFALIKKNATKLLLLVNQLMDFRKIELNKMTLKLTNVELVSFLNDIVSSFEGLAKQRRIDCRLITKEASMTAIIDPEKIEKVLCNILSNAFKFTGSGGHIYIMFSTDVDRKNFIIEIEDSGLGMNAEEQTHVFELFYQGAALSENGSGIGLSLSKELIDLHSGSITIKSEPSKGSTFSIKLPVRQVDYESLSMDHNNITSYSSQASKWVDHFVSNEPQILENAADHQREHKTYAVLVVEDNQDLRNFLCKRLSLEYNIIAAKDGREGIKLCFDKVPDLIISDVMMPHTDGLQLTRILKADIRTSHIPIVLLTAKTSEDHITEGLKTKADAYITKPFSIDILEQTIQNLIENRKTVQNHLSLALPAGLSLDQNDKSFMNSLNAIIEKNISNEKFSIQDICDELKISKTQLYRKARPLLETNINEFILGKRIQRARYLIRHKDYSLSEIAYQCGFASPSYFSTAFKKLVGETPKLYKEKMKL